MSEAERVVAAAFRAEWGGALATLVRLLGGDFDLAEEALQEAFLAAQRQWSREGPPQNPRAWLVTVARRRAVDGLRRRGRFAARSGEIAYEIESQAAEVELADDDKAEAQDDRLRLVFTCCHPALAPEARVALALRAVCGLATEEIARLFLTPTPTMAQRLTRAKRKIREARIPYAAPKPEDLPERLEGVLAVVYLVFTEGYAATRGERLVRPQLCDEAIRLGRLLAELLPQESEADALLALMLLHDARRDTRLGPDGELATLDEQDRRLWDGGKIAEGLERVERVLRHGRPGRYALEAAIAAVHGRAARADATDWRQIRALYEVLLRLHPSPVVELNHAVAVAMADGPEPGLRLLDSLAARGALAEYGLLLSARAELLRRLGRRADAAAAYRAALGRAALEPERRYLHRRLAEVER